MGPTSSYRVSAPKTTTVMVASPSAGGVHQHLDGYRRPQEELDAQELRVEESRSDVYIQAETLRLRAESENVRAELQLLRDAQKLELARQRQNQRTAESWSRIIRDQLNDASRRAEREARIKERERQARAREMEQASRELNRLADRVERNNR